MQNKPQSTLAAVLAATLIALASGSAAAIDVGDRIEVHGYGDLGHEVANVYATGRGLGDRERERVTTSRWSGSGKPPID